LRFYVLGLRICFGGSIIGADRRLAYLLHFGICRIYPAFTSTLRKQRPYPHQPVSPGNLVWLFISRVVGYSIFEHSLQKSLFDRTKFTIIGWRFRCKHTAYDALGPLLFLCLQGAIPFFLRILKLWINFCLGGRDFCRVGVGASRFLVGYGK
jgi:hypothetical protein